MSTYSLVPEPEEYISVSGLGSYVAQEEPEAYVAVSGLGSYVAQQEPEAYVAVSGLGQTEEQAAKSMTGMWVLLALAAGSAGYMYWRLRQAGVSLAPAKASVMGLDELGHSGRTYYRVFPKHRGYGHTRLGTGRFHFHPRSTRY